MKFTAQLIPDLILIEPNYHGDDHGYFSETFRQDLLEDVLGYQINFVLSIFNRKHATFKERQITP